LPAILIVCGVIASLILFVHGSDLAAAGGFIAGPAMIGLTAIVRAVSKRNR
jgi:hypothetical protein